MFDLNLHQSANDHVDLARQLKISEYESLRTLININIDNMEKNETYMGTAFAATTLFLVSDARPSVIEHGPLLFAVSALPVIIAVFGYVRFVGLDSVIDLTNSYIKKMYENENTPISWSRYYKKRKSKWLKLTRYVFWAILVFVGSLLFAYLNARYLDMLRNYISA